jgi:hypothetical protein
VVFPVFETGAASPDPELLTFQGIEVLPGERACIANLSRLVKPDRFPLLIPAVLPPDWQARPLFEQLREWERLAPEATAGRVSYWSPERLAVERSTLLPRVPSAPRFAPGVDYNGRIATVAAGGTVHVDGFADAAGSYLVAWRATTFDADSVVIVEGRIDRGGLTAGLVDAAGWVTKIDIGRPGLFRAALQPPRAGAYQLVIANYLRGGSRKTRADITRIAVVSGGA